MSSPLPPSTGVSAGCSSAALSLAAGGACAAPLAAALWPAPFPANTNYTACTWAGLCLVGDPPLIYGRCALCAAPAACRAALALAAADPACAAPDDALAVALLRDQGAGAVCAAGAARQTPGSANLGGQLTQCSTCGVVPCPAGWLCAKDTPPRACPAGFACAAGTGVAEPCAAGFFCAPGDELAPVACRATAFGSCAAGASREFVWVPALLALVAIAAVRALTLALERGRKARAAAALAAATASVGASAASSAALATASASASGSGGGRGGGLGLVLSLALSASSARPATSPAAPGNAADGSVGGGVARGTLSMTFRDLSLVTRGVRRLDGVSGALRPARLTAIMGGSGAGKTTLLNVLLGKDAPTAGAVTVRVRRAGATESAAASGPGAVLAPAQLRAALGFVPQTDLLLPELTAREAVLHAAAARLPADLRGPALAARADAALAALGLARRAHDLAGALSASDRKRLSIAGELVAEPLLLVLDEPTTGLDASSALGVVETVRELAARRGLTVAAVLHQPRPEIFALVDELVLLGRGGRPVFLGPRRLVEGYFSEVLGFAPPGDTALADFIMDAVQGSRGAPPCAGKGAARDATAVAEALAAAWRGRGEAWVAERAGVDDAAKREGEEEGKREGAPWVAQPRRGFLAQTALYFARALRQRLRGGATVGALLGFLLGGCVAGLVFSGGPLYVAPAAWWYFRSCPSDGRTFCVDPQAQMYQPGPFYQAMIVGALAVPTAVKSYGGERAHAWREAGVGADRCAYFLGVALCDAALVWPLCALAFVGPMVLIAPLRGPVENFFALAWATVAMCSSIAWAVSAVTGTATELATLAGVILAVVLNLFGGFVPLVGSYGYWAYTHWAQRAFAANELLLGYKVERSLFNALVPSEWEDPDFAADVGYLVVMSVLTAALALALTVGLHRDKQR